MPYQRSEARRREEQDLFARLAAGDEMSRDVLVERFLPLARQLARGFAGRAELEDLEQVAAIGLVKAIDRFDLRSGYAFSTFATPTILGEIKRHFRDRMWSVRVPRSIKELSSRVEHVADDLAGELGRSPTVAEIAARADASSERVLEALQASIARYPVSLDEPRELSDEPSPGNHEVAVEEAGYRDVEMDDMLNDLMRVLTARDRVILELRFREDRVQSQIAESLGLSQMHVSRLIRDALEQLRMAASPLL